MTVTEYDSKNVLVVNNFNVFLEHDLGIRKILLYCRLLKVVDATTLQYQRYFDVHMYCTNCGWKLNKF